LTIDKTQCLSIPQSERYANERTRDSLSETLREHHFYNGFDWIDNFSGFSQQNLTTTLAKDRCYLRRVFYTHIIELGKPNMKRSKVLANSLFAGLTILHLSIAGIAQADPNAGRGRVYVPMMDASFPAMSAKFGMGVTPFNLVFLAFQGFFASEGIPSASGLEQSYRNGTVNPQTLVKAAIAMNRLPASSIDDKTYLDEVKSQLDNLVRN
jgi:hypothetical protein